MLARAALALGFALPALALALQEEPPSQEEPMPERTPFAAFDLAELTAAAVREQRSWTSFFDNETLECGLYRVAAGAADGQRPHERDELYYVAAGRGRFTAGDETREVGPGAVLFVAAQVEHRFHDVAEDLELLVVFSKAEIPAPQEREDR